jgi:hypothetical protein
MMAKFDKTFSGSVSWLKIADVSGVTSVSIWFPDAPVIFNQTTHGS